MGRTTIGPKRGIHLSDEQFRILRDIGKGNASRGVRLLIEVQVSAAREVMRRESLARIGGLD